MSFLSPVFPAACDRFVWEGDNGPGHRYGSPLLPLFGIFCDGDVIHDFLGQVTRIVK
jgi:hypothetical protein